MVILSDNEMKLENRQSSKGNQLKWLYHDRWYKADYAGYEGLSEFVVSNLLRYSNLSSDEYVVYQTEEIQYGKNTMHGCSSPNFLPDEWELITIERLFHDYYGKSLYQGIYQIQSIDNRIRFLVEQTEKMTGIRDFGVYISKVITIDTLFLNEDRHTHNIAVLKDETGYFHTCPIFDNGAALLSDTKMDYPENGDIYYMLGEVQAKTFCHDFDEQLDRVERLYGQHIHLSLKHSDIEALLEQEKHYSSQTKERVKQILDERRRKYRYLFD